MFLFPTLCNPEGPVCLQSCSLPPRVPEDMEYFGGEQLRCLVIVLNKEGKWVYTRKVSIASGFFCLIKRIESWLEKKFKKFKGLVLFGENICCN